MNDKYYDKTAHAQTGPHVCNWRESNWRPAIFE